MRSVAKQRTERRYVVFLRAISNVGMSSFRKRLENLGFTDVESYGMSGNLIFNSRGGDIASLERRITARFRTPAFVRTRSELARIVAQDPFGSTILLLARPPTGARLREFKRLDLAAPRPVIRGKTVFFVYPVRQHGRKSPVDIERALGVPATARSAKVVGRILDLMSDEGPRSGRIGLQGRNRAARPRKPSVS